MMGTNEKDIQLVDFDSDKLQTPDLWFHDSIEFAHGCRLQIKIRNVLYHARSKYQLINVFETEKLGRMLVIDGITMLTESDEFAYHEMIAHVPLLIHPRPRRVLVIGGGDGGTVREVLKHREVESVHVCEIDEEVVRACREHLPSLASSFDDPRVEILYRDGAHHVTKHPKSYEIIIVDSTDPVGPGQVLFQRPFYEDMKGALSEGGIAVTQCESFYLHQHVIRGVFAFAREVFPRLDYYYTLVPTYPSGLIGFYFCSLTGDPHQEVDAERLARLGPLKYYTPEIHRAAFALPQFAVDFFQT